MSKISNIAASIVSAFDEFAMALRNARMIKPNPQIELHRAWFWTCDECGGDNFERCMVRQFLSHDEMYGPDEESACNMSDEEVEELVGVMDDDDGDEVCSCGDPECDGEGEEAEDDDEGMIAIESYSVPQCLECEHCGNVFDDVKLSEDGI